MRETKVVNSGLLRTVGPRRIPNIYEVVSVCIQVQTNLICLQPNCQWKRREHRSGQSWSVYKCSDIGPGAATWAARAAARAFDDTRGSLQDLLFTQFDLLGRILGQKVRIELETSTRFRKVTVGQAVLQYHDTNNTGDGTA